MLQEHWRKWECPFDCVGTVSTPSHFREHLVDCHAHATRVSAEEMSFIISHNSKPDLDQPQGACPLCKEVKITSIRQYKSHVGHHLEELALFVLPPSDYDEEDQEDNSEIAHDTPGEMGRDHKEEDEEDEGDNNEIAHEAFEGAEAYKQDGNPGRSDADSLVPTCEICQWEPDIRNKRSLDKQQKAVEKHIKRNHRSKDFRCPICNQNFKNRADNVKSHVQRKHPEKFQSLYPSHGTRAPHDGISTTSAEFDPEGFQRDRFLSRWAPSLPWLEEIIVRPEGDDANDVDRHST